MYWSFVLSGKNFGALISKKISQSLNDKVIFDGRNLFEPEIVEGYGIKYFGIGRGR